MSDQRAVPFYCPFCAEEDLFPAEETHGSWHCRSCTRVFSLRLVGLRRQAADETTAEGAPVLGPASEVSR